MSDPDSANPHPPSPTPSEPDLNIPGVNTSHLANKGFTPNYIQETTEMLGDFHHRMNDYWARKGWTEENSKPKAPILQGLEHSKWAPKPPPAQPEGEAQAAVSTQSNPGGKGKFYAQSKVAGLGSQGDRGQQRVNATAPPVGHAEAGHGTSTSQAMISSGTKSPRGPHFRRKKQSSASASNSRESRRAIDTLGQAVPQPETPGEDGPPQFSKPRPVVRPPKPTEK